MKKIAVAVLLFCLSALALPAQDKKAEEKPVPTTAASTSNAPSLQEHKPSAEFLSSFDDLTALLRSIDRIERETGIVALKNQANVLAKNLRNQIPDGYQFDGEKKEFVLIPKPATDAKPAK